MPKQSILFVINPISGSGKTIHWESLITTHLDISQFNFQIEYTQAPGDATILAKEAAKNGTDVVCAVGGDGTINEVAQGLINTNTALAIVPRGSGNGLARHLSISVNPILALKKINSSKKNSIDVGLLNGKLFLCVAGMGFDATVARAFDQFGKRGFLSYAWISVRSYFSYQPQTYTLVFDQKKITTKAFLIAFANASQFGNNAYIAPSAQINDGLLNLVIVKPFPIWSAPSLIFQVFNKSILRSKYCETYLFKSLQLKTPHPTTHLDGEPIASEQSTEVSALSGALKVLY